MRHVTLAHVTFKIDHVIICKMHDLHLLESAVAHWNMQKHVQIINKVIYKYNNLQDLVYPKMRKSTVAMTRSWELKLKPNYVLNINSHGLK